MGGDDDNALFWDHGNLEKLRQLLIRVAQPPRAWEITPYETNELLKTFSDHIGSEPVSLPADLARRLVEALRVAVGKGFRLERDLVALQDDVEHLEAQVARAEAKGLVRELDAITKQRADIVAWLRSLGENALADQIAEQAELDG